MRRFQLPPEVQLGVSAALLAREPDEQLHSLGHVGGVVEVMRDLVDAAAGAAFDPSDRVAGRPSSIGAACRLERINGLASRASGCDPSEGPAVVTAKAFHYAQPSCCREMLEFQIFVRWSILSPLNCIT